MSSRTEAPAYAAGTTTPSSWRIPAALGAFGMGVTHIPVIEEHLTEAPYLGLGFLLVSVLGLLLAHELLEGGATVTWVAAAVTALFAIVAFLVSRTVGLPEAHHDIGAWGDRLAWTAVASEVLLLVSASMHLWSRSEPDS